MKFRKLLVSLLSLVLIFTGAGWSSISSVVSEKKGVFKLGEFVIKKKPDHILLDWNDVEGAKKYVVKCGEDVVYLGNISEFTQEELDEGSLNEYSISAIDDNDTIIDNVYLKVFTPIEDETYRNIGVDVIANDNSIVLDWPSVEKSEEYNVYRNGELLGTVLDSLFVDENLSEDTVYNYTIETKVKFSDEKIQDLKHKLIAYAKRVQQEEFREGVPIKQYSVDEEENENSDETHDSEHSELETAITDLENNPYDIVVISTQINTLPKLSAPISLDEFVNSRIVSALQSLPSQSSIRINTMILNTDKYNGYLPGPGSSKYYYSTDNRTTIDAYGSTRSSLTATINWSDRSVIQTKSVGITKQYSKNSNGQYIYESEKLASGENVYLGVTKKTQSMVDINFLHKAGNPFYTFAPPVDYEFRSEIYRDGTTNMRGYHTLFPSMGIFRNDGQGYRTLYTHNQGSRTPWDLYANKIIDFSNSGKGWQYIEGTWYYFDSSGAMQTGWQSIGGAWYYFNSSGAMQTGWQSVGGKWYYFNSGGAMLTGSQSIRSTWYYFNSSGAMQTGWQSIVNTWYYFNSSGAMQTGWQSIGSTWYYFNSSGGMQTGWQYIGSNWYYFYSSGAMAFNTTIDGYKLGPDGKML
ncbi:DUF3238 domain-containing protein [Neobacillus sp.]|uniref:N-acetylmuramoyl-L-alanine amidase family protein n=1 Tax=Neobacillus sp. TaxID=2675273 RepID=UPI00289B6450|nr:DUF3238 domain-containing protein [Neobacillus sp.]